MTAREQDVLRRAGEASVLILVSLADGPKHGYALIQDVKQFAGVELGPGTLYGALDRLDRLGLIESLPADERRHPYRITAPGAAALRVHLDSLERVSATGRAAHSASSSALSAYSCSSLSVEPGEVSSAEKSRIGSKPLAAPR